MDKVLENVNNKNQVIGILESEGLSNKPTRNWWYFETDLSLA